MAKQPSGAGALLRREEHHVGCSMTEWWYETRCAMPERALAL